MRKISKPTSAKCTINIYVKNLLVNPMNATCTNLSNILEEISHDSINRFLMRENYTSRDYFHQIAPHIVLEGGIANIDDSVLDKPYSDINKTDLIGFFYSGKHKKTVKGINLITLFYTDPNGVRVPVNWRVYDKKDGKTKNEYFREMLEEVISWGLKPRAATGDSWYASLDNLKYVRKCGLVMMFGIESNRLVSIEYGKYIQVKNIETWENDSAIVYLKEFGTVKVFREFWKNTYRYYIIALPKIDDLQDFDHNQFKEIHDAHWTIEQFHRAIKQLCNIEKFQVRNTTAISNHIFCSFVAFTVLEFGRVQKKIRNWYEFSFDFFKGLLRYFILNTGNKLEIPFFANSGSAVNA